MQLRSFILFLFTSFSYVTLPTDNLQDTATKHTENNVENQYIDNFGDPDILDHFFKLPRYTKDSYKCFLTNTYNHNKYACKFLALNFSHVSTFLGYTAECDYPRAYIKSVLKLFGQKLKSTTYINAYAFSELLQQLPELIKLYFVADKENQEKKDTIKSCLTSFFENKFERLKQNPESALEDLAQTICNITIKRNTDKDGETDIAIDELQYATVSFLELSLNKLIWNPIDQKEVWGSVKIISLQLEELYIQNMIPSVESLDELYWSLINRFCYFLELSGAELNEASFQEINNDLNANNVLWAIEEREPYITSKLEFLRQAVLQAEISAKVARVGITPRQDTCITAAAA